MEIMKISGADVIPAGFSVAAPQEETKPKNDEPKESPKVKESTIDTYA